MATASFSSSSLLLTLALSSLLFSCSAQSSGCKSQIFSSKKNFSDCSDLPYLNSTLHWTFDSKTSNLTLAFTATPANTGGWIAWGINPTGLKMLGTQALVAYSVGGVPVVRTFDLNSFSSIVEGKISYNVSDLTAEMSGDGKMSIFATVMLPRNITTINLVWQVGPGVDGGKPLPHAMNMENMMSTGVLVLEGGGGAPVSPPTVAPSPGTGGGVPIPPPVGAPSPTHSGGGVPVPPPAQASSPTPGGGVPIPPPVRAPSPTHSGGGVPVPPPAQASSPTPGGGVPIPPPVGTPSPTHSGGGVPVPPPAQASSPTPGGGGVPVPPSVGGGGVSPPPQAGAPSPIG